MMYFIPWVVLLLAVILSVPIAAFLDKRKLQAAYAAQGMSDDFDEYDDENGEGEEEVGEEVEEGEAEAVIEEADEFGGEGEELADDEFAAFE